MTQILFALRRSSTLTLLPALHILVYFFLLTSVTAQNEKREIMVGSKLTKDFGMGVDSSEHKKGWVSKEPEYMKIVFPPYQEWAAVFITVGKPVDLPRPWVDLSANRTLSMDMRGELGGELIEIGIKSNIQPDEGEEIKVTVKLTPTWKNYTFSLDRFEGADLKHLYVVTELVYNGQSPQTVYFRNINYLK